MGDWAARGEPVKCSSLLFFIWCGPFLKSLLDLLQDCFCFMFWFFGREACGILAPKPGIEPSLPTLEGKVSTTGPKGKSLQPLDHQGSHSSLREVWCGPTLFDLLSGNSFKFCFCLTFCICILQPFSKVEDNSPPVNNLFFFNRWRNLRQKWVTCSSQQSNSPREFRKDSESRTKWFCGAICSPAAEMVC